MANLSRAEVAILSARLYAALDNAGLSPAKARTVIDNPEIAATMVAVLEQKLQADEPEIPDFEWDSTTLDRVVAWAFDGIANYERNEVGIAEFTLGYKEFFKQLEGDARRKEYILYLRAQSLTLSSIAERVGRSPSSVSQSISNTTHKIWYFVTKAQERHMEAAKAGGS